MGQASKIQDNPNWNLEKTLRQVEQKFATDLKTITGKTTNDEKLLTKLVCLERQTTEQIPGDYEEHQNICPQESVSYLMTTQLSPSKLYNER